MSAANEGAFRLRTVVLLVIVGVVGFVGTLVLGAFEPDLRNGHNGGAHALSVSAVGYSGLVRLAQATGRDASVVRNEHLLWKPGLLVITPEHGWVPIGDALEARARTPILVVLPKWETEADKRHAGWARGHGLLDFSDAEGVVGPQQQVRLRLSANRGGPFVTAPGLPRLRFVAPRSLQVISRYELRPVYRHRRLVRWDGHLRPLIEDGHGGVVLGQLDGRPEYVLSDPDLLNNMGIKRLDGAASALALLDWLTPAEDRSIGFDVTLNGFGHSQSPLKLAFEPPFLAMTLAIAAALALAGWHATGQFGARVRPARAIAFGKRALVDNAAALIGRAGRQARMGGRYAAVVRERARTAFGAPSRLHGAELDAYLDRLPGRARFTELAAAADAAQDNHSLVDAAQALNVWRGHR